MGSTRQAQQPSQPMPPSAAVQAPGAAAPQASPAPTAAVQLPSGAVQQVPAATAAAAAATAAATPVVPAASATYRSLGLHKGMTEAEVIKLLGPPVKITRGVPVMWPGWAKVAGTWWQSLQNAAWSAWAPVAGSGPPGPPWQVPQNSGPPGCVWQPAEVQATPTAPPW